MSAMLLGMSAESPVIQMTGRLAPRSGWGPPAACPIIRTFDAVSTRTAYALMREAFYGAARFEEFVARSGVSEPVAAARLRELTEEGLLEKVPYREPGQRTRYGYQLTEKGTALLPVLVAMVDWSDRWSFPDGARVQLKHTGCGSRVHAELRCEDGHPVEFMELEPVVRRAGRSGSE
jgi:DNA-binding HxlR family transcriptional regulator